MPTLNINDWQSDGEIGKAIACANVLSAMYFHNDPEKMKAYVVFIIAQHIETLNRTEKKYDLLEYIEPFGGIKILNEAPNDEEIAKCHRDGVIAGSMLFDIWRFRLLTASQLPEKELMSVNKANVLAQKKLKVFGVN